MLDAKCSCEERTQYLAHTKKTTTTENLQTWKRESCSHLWLVSSHCHSLGKKVSTLEQWRGNDVGFSTSCYLVSTCVKIIYLRLLGTQLRFKSLKYSSFLVAAFSFFPNRDMQKLRTWFKFPLLQWQTFLGYECLLRFCNSLDARKYEGWSKITQNPIITVHMIKKKVFNYYRARSANINTNELKNSNTRTKQTSWCREGQGTHLI